MKYMLLVGAVLVAIGAGCTAKPVAPVETTENGTSVKSSEPVEGVWHLSFVLPKSWVLVPQYNEDTENLPLTNAVNSQMTDVVVQSTGKPIALTGQSELPEGAYVTEDYVYIRVFRMDKASIIPAEAEDIGGGIARRIEGINATYYFKGKYANYKFVVYYNGRELREAEDVIRTAKEVTNFTQ